VCNCFQMRSSVERIGSLKHFSRPPPRPRFPRLLRRPRVAHSPAGASRRQASSSAAWSGQASQGERGEGTRGEVWAGLGNGGVGNAGGASIVMSTGAFEFVRIPNI